MTILENAGHVSNLEYPHEFAKALSDFLAELDGVGKEEDNLSSDEGRQATAG